MCWSQAVVEPTNELKEAEIALRVEEQRILREMSTLLLKNLPAIEASLEAASSLDLTVARVRLGRKLGGLIPDVQSSGLISLKGFRHPQLLLRHGSIEKSPASITVVGNDLALNASVPGLVLTGPNAGGKTVRDRPSHQCATTNKAQNNIKTKNYLRLYPPFVGCVCVWGGVGGAQVAWASSTHGQSWNSCSYISWFVTTRRLF